MNRIWHPWTKWEDIKYNFYGSYPVDKSLKCTRIYAELLRNTDEFEKALKVIISQWKFSCEHNLSNESLNRVAYLGQAACALNYKIPHFISCSGYNLLSEDEKVTANKKAEEYLNKWIENFEREKINVAA